MFGSPNDLEPTLVRHLHHLERVGFDLLHVNAMLESLKVDR